MAQLIEKIRRERANGPRKRHRRVEVRWRTCDLCGEAVPCHRYAWASFRCLCRDCYQDCCTGGAA